MSDFYSESMDYERFIRRAYNKIQPSSRNGAHQHFMRNLMITESGNPSLKYVGSFEKQFPIVQNYIRLALEKFLKAKLTDEERSAMELLHKRIDTAQSTSELNSIVVEGLSVTMRLI